MKPVSVKQLAEIIQSPSARTLAERKAGGLDNVVVKGVCTDSREIRQGDCFFAISGPSFDGFDYIRNAVEKGAVCAVAQKDCPDSSAIVLKVDDTIAALGRLGRWYRKQLAAKVVAITGSAGKTTTRRIIHHVLSAGIRCNQSPKSFNNNIGVPLTLLSTEAEHEVLIAELGSNAPGEIAYLTDIVLPDIAVVTNVYPAHLEGFGSVENIAKEKASICLGLSDDGVFLVNGDCPQLLEQCDRLGRGYVTFGTGSACRIRATEMVSDGQGGRLTIEDTEIVVPLAGKANLQNVLAAWAVCRQMGISIEQFAAAAATLEPPPMRLATERIGKVTLINDCYNANPASMANAVDCLRNIAAQDDGARTVFVCGTMAELGRYSDGLHEQLGRLVGSSGIDVLVAVGGYARTVADAASQTAGNGFQSRVFADNTQLCDNLVDIIMDGDIILVKGSRSAALEKAVEKLRQLFSED